MKRGCDLYLIIYERLNFTSPSSGIPSNRPKFGNASSTETIPNARPDPAASVFSSINFCYLPWSEWRRVSKSSNKAVSAFRLLEEHPAGPTRQANHVDSLIDRCQPGLLVSRILNTRPSCSRRSVSLRIGELLCESPIKLVHGTEYRVVEPLKNHRRHDQFTRHSGKLAGEECLPRARVTFNSRCECGLNLKE